MLDLQKASETIRGVFALALRFEVDEDQVLSAENLAALQRICTGQYDDHDLNRFSDFTALFTNWSAIHSIAPHLPSSCSTTLRVQVNYWLRCNIFRELLHFFERHQYGQQDKILQDWIQTTKTQLEQDYRNLPGIRSAQIRQTIEEILVVLIPIYIMILAILLWQDETPVFSSEASVKTKPMSDSMQYFCLMGLPILAVSSVTLGCFKYWRSPKEVVVPQLELSEELHKRLENK